MWKKLKKRLKLQEITWQATVVLLATIAVQGIVLFYSLYFGFVTGNFAPFYAVLAGSGWFAFMVDRVATWGRK